MTWFPKGHPFVTGGGVIAPPIGTSANGWDRAKLAAIRDIEDGVLFQGGGEAFAWGNPDESREWASCGRAGVSMTCWMHECSVQPGLSIALDLPIGALGTPAALAFPSHQRLCDVLAYINAIGRWQYSYGWRDMDDVFFEVTGTRIHDYFNQQIAPRLGGNIRARENSADGTPRLVASARDAVRWALMMLENGDGLIASALVRRVLGGGPDGNGSPWDLEGMQVHLIRHGAAWELNIPTVPDGFMARDGSADVDRGHGIIAGFPNQQIAFAYRGGTPQRVLPALFNAVIP